MSCNYFLNVSLPLRRGEASHRLFNKYLWQSLDSVTLLFVLLDYHNVVGTL